MLRQKHTLVCILMKPIRRVSNRTIVGGDLLNLGGYFLGG